MTRVLVLTGGSIGEHMAGPALRAWNIARVLAVEHVVTLATTGHLKAGEAAFTQTHIDAGDESEFRRLEAAADVIVFQGLANQQFRSLRRSRRVLVADLYDPMHIEQLERTRSLGESHAEREVASATWLVDEQLLVADLVLCASDRQRHFYIGHLAALGRITPRRYRADPDLEKLIMVVPFGLSSEKLVHDRAALRGVVDGIQDTDKILIWAGGIHEWLDPETLIRAVGHLAVRRTNLRLFFMGTKVPGAPELPIVFRARQLASDLGLLGISVFFNDGWVPWEDRHNYLLEADAGVSTHRPHLETEFSFRTRVLDYLWACLPVVLTAGDTFAELAEHRGLGAVADAGDVKALAEAIDQVVYNDEYRRSIRRNVEQVRLAFVWEHLLRPLSAFIADPQPSPDRLRGRRSPLRRSFRTIRPEPRSAAGRTMRRAEIVIRREGIWALLRRGLPRARR
jgi:glycosyltransferase involved in cell wall biosynthesis